MARIFITGSSDGLGSLAAQALVRNGHKVTLHGRNAQRAADAEKACPGSEGALIGDLSSTKSVKELAKDLESRGPWDCIIHNAGVMHISSTSKGPEGIPTLFATNTIAPYMLTCLISPPKRLIFLSSSMHQGGDPSLKNLQNCSYSDSKLHNTILAMYFAKRLQDCEVNSLDPGWVQTKMGGSAASDDINESVKSYVMLAEGCGQTGEHWYHSKPKAFMKQAGDTNTQSRLIDELQSISGVSLPGEDRSKA